MFGQPPQHAIQSSCAVAQLNHPNIVTAYDAGEHEGLHYLVMEYVDGVSLADIVAQPDCSDSSSSV